jgi:hypothetical protein
MLTGIDKLGKFYLHVGGLGDLFYTLASGYDNEKEITLLSYANNPTVIEDVIKHFPKITQSIVLQNKGDYADMAAAAEKAHSIAHLPPNLDYANWPIYLKDMKIDQTSWLDEIPTKKEHKIQVCVQPMGHGAGGGEGKHVAIHLHYWQLILDNIRKAGYVPCVLGVPAEKVQYPRLEEEDYTHLNVWDQMQMIKGADVVIACDSWTKNLSLYNNIPTIVMKNFFINYNNPMHEYNDPADPVFINYWALQGAPIKAVDQKQVESIKQLTHVLGEIWKAIDVLIK